MLGKLRRLTEGALPGPGSADGHGHDLQDRFGPDLTDLQPLPGGTHGAVFTGMLCGRQMVFKTSVLPQDRPALIREKALLDLTAGARVEARLAGEETERVWLQMLFIPPCPPLTPLQVRQMTAGHSAVLTQAACEGLLPAEDDFAFLLAAAHEAAALLASQGLLAPDIHHRCAVLLDHLDRESPRWPQQICHGDLGPLNIRQDDKGPLAIDWGDAFRGPPGFDALGWLTFFSSRKWLTGESLGFTGLGKTSEIAIMIMIILLKCRLSLHTGTAAGNSLSFDQRLGEVLHLENS